MTAIGDVYEGLIGKKQCIGGCKRSRNVTVAPTGSLNTQPVRVFRRKQAEGIAEITFHVEPSQLSFIQDDNSWEVLETLMTVHQSRGMASRLALRQFLCLVKSEGSMQNLIGEARRLALQLQENGVTVEDEDLILVLTGGLGSSYDNFVITLDSQ
jgi:hypothetical protein